MFAEEQKCVAFSSWIYQFFSFFFGFTWCPLCLTLILLAQFLSVYLSENWFFALWLGITVVRLTTRRKHDGQNIMQISVSPKKFIYYSFAVTFSWKLSVILCSYWIQLFNGATAPNTLCRLELHLINGALLCNLV